MDDGASAVQAVHSTDGINKGTQLRGVYYVNTRVRSSALLMSECRSLQREWAMGVEADGRVVTSDRMRSW